MLRFGLFCLMALPLAAAPPPRDSLGRGEKLRILVDKVMQPVADWHTERWMISESAAAGFNVYSPRHGFDDLEAVRRVSRWCAEDSIYHLVWMRGTLTAPRDPRGDGLRMVWHNGVEQEFYAPSAAAFWAWTEQYILEYARLAAEEPGLLGVFLDYENYAPNRQGDAYDLSYDLGVLGRFAEAEGFALPDLPAEGRKAWLTEQGRHDAFAAFSIGEWRARCRDLRAKVDAICPEFWFVIYPAPGTLFMREAAWPEWGTAHAPLVLADAHSYGRPAKMLPEREALATNRRRMADGEALAQAAGISYLYAGGIDPIVRGADPEFCGKNAVMLADQTDGYWVFYEGPTYAEDHRDYFRWFTWANEAIAAGRYAAQHEPRQTPDGWDAEILGRLGPDLRLAPPEVSGQTVEFPATRLRADNLLLVAARRGQRVELVVQPLPLSNYRDPLTWEARAPDRTSLGSGRIECGQEGTIAFDAADDGVYPVPVAAGLNPYRLVRGNVPVGILAGEGIGLIGEAAPLYGWSATGRFSVTARAGATETVRIAIGETTGETGAEATSLELRLDRAPGLFEVRVGRASTGTLEDYRLSLGEGAAPVLSLLPEHVFRLEAP